jgi:hypothetical protein
MQSAADIAQAETIHPEIILQFLDRVLASAPSLVQPSDLLARWDQFSDQCESILTLITSARMPSKSALA